jgi:putative surface cell wall-binding protein
MRTEIRSIFVVVALVTLVVAAAPPTLALAATDTTSVTLTGGTLSFTTAPTAANFPATTLTGATQTIATDFDDWRVNDARGTGAGWNVSFQATQFSDGGSNTLPAGSLKVKVPAVTAVDPLNLAAPPVAQGLPPWTIDNGAAVKVFSALAGTGAGEWNFDQANILAAKDLQLTVPASAAAGTYTSTLTFTLASGP